MTIGTDLQHARAEAGVDQKTLAALAGITAAQLCRIEAGQYQPRIATLEKIADALGCELEITLTTKNKNGKIKKANRPNNRNHKRD